MAMKLDRLDGAGKRGWDADEQAGNELRFSDINGDPVMVLRR
jgi:hypothetical protein